MWLTRCHCRENSGSLNLNTSAGSVLVSVKGPFLLKSIPIGGNAFAFVRAGLGSMSYSVSENATMLVPINQAAGQGCQIRTPPSLEKAN